MVMMSPVRATTKPAPAETLTFFTVTMKSLGAPSLEASSDREYWKRVERTVADAPSTLSFILPEVYLGEEDEERIAAIRENMYAALENDVLSKLTRGVIFARDHVNGGASGNGKH